MKSAAFILILTWVILAVVRGLAHAETLFQAYGDARIKEYHALKALPKDATQDQIDSARQQATAHYNDIRDAEAKKKMQAVDDSNAGFWNKLKQKLKGSAAPTAQDSGEAAPKPEAPAAPTRSTRGGTTSGAQRVGGTGEPIGAPGGAEAVSFGSGGGDSGN